MVEQLTRAPAGPALPPAVRLPWGRWSRTHVGIGLTALLAGVLNVAALNQRDARVPVAVAAQAVEPGARLRPQDVTATALDAEAAVLGALLRAGDPRVREGWIVWAGLAPGEPIRVSDLRPPDWTQGRRAMSVPVEPEHAVAGSLRAGDRVDVVGVRNGAASWVALGAEVLHAPDEPPGEGLGDVTAYAVTLAVSEAQALELALALRDGHVEVLRSTGAPPVGAPEAIARGASAEEEEAGDAQ